MGPGVKYVRYGKECPFCKSMVTGALGTNLVCNCNSKYYFFDKVWLNRNTGEEIFEFGTVHFKDGHTEGILKYDDGYDGVRVYFETESGWYKRHLTSNPEQNGKYIYSKLLATFDKSQFSTVRQLWVVTHDIEKIELKEQK